MNGFSVGEFLLSSLGYVESFAQLMISYWRKLGPASLGVFVEHVGCSSPFSVIILLCLICYFQKGLWDRGQILSISGLVCFMTSVVILHVARAWTRQNAIKQQCSDQ